MNHTERYTFCPWFFIISNLKLIRKCQEQLQEIGQFNSRAHFMLFAMGTKLGVWVDKKINWIFSFHLIVIKLDKYITHMYTKTFMIKNVCFLWHLTDASKNNSNFEEKCKILGCWFEISKFQKFYSPNPNFRLETCFVDDISIL